MKKIKICILTIMLFTTHFLIAQENEKIVVPLSQPGKPGSLVVGIIQGSIKVSGHNGKDVIVNVQSAEDAKSEGEDKKTSNGMRKIKNSGIELEIEEEDNKVKIKSGSFMKEINITVLVPSNFSLKISTVNDGNLVVENVNGEIEANNVNGDIFLKEITGSAVVNTVNGKIEATFKEIDSNKSMAFTTLNGELDITFPANAKASVKMKSDMGEMFSDFEFQPANSPGKVETNNTGRGTKYKLDKWIHGSINGGGAEYLFKTMHGNIYIRKGK